MTPPRSRWLARWKSLLTAPRRPARRAAPRFRPAVGRLEDGLAPAVAGVFGGGVRVAVGDVNGDGFNDIVTAAGPGAAPHVKVFDGATGALLQSFLAFDAGFTGGVTVAAGDVNGDGKADIITGAGPGAAPHVRVFDGATGGELSGLIAYDGGFTGGAYVAAGDFTGDGRADLVTGAGPGASAIVRALDGTSLAPLAAFIAYDPVTAVGGFSAPGITPPNGDRAPPTVQISSPGTTSQNVTIQGIASDNVAVTSLTAQVDGATPVLVGLGPGGTFHFTTAIGPGRHGRRPAHRHLPGPRRRRQPVAACGLHFYTPDHGHAADVGPRPGVGHRRQRRPAHRAGHGLPDRHRLAGRRHDPAEGQHARRQRPGGRERRVPL
jgi:hypothetical protein